MCKVQGRLRHRDTETASAVSASRFIRPPASPRGERAHYRTPRCSQRCQFPCATTGIRSRLMLRLSPTNVVSIHVEDVKWKKRNGSSGLQYVWYLLGGFLRLLKLQPRKYGIAGGVRYYVTQTNFNIIIVRSSLFISAKEAADVNGTEH